MDINKGYNWICLSPVQAAFGLSGNLKKRECLMNLFGQFSIARTLVRQT
jgi:hypothetical protein